ncbi:MAG: SDR family oxidoreductase [Thaumarchaeota archaeon]|nr:SDR family oxidoreductase [Nitrososphaerota archaeon]
MAPGTSSVAEGRRARLLEGKTAVIYGAAGGVGSSVAKAFAREGAEVFLAGRTLSSLEKVAGEISAEGGRASAAAVNALVPSEIGAHLNRIVEGSGRLDISFNLIGSSVGMGRTLTNIPEARFLELAFSVVNSNFLTSTAAARHMEGQGSGVILGLSAITARIPRANQGGFAIGGAAMEALFRQLALEVGPRGVRVVCIRTHGTPDNPTLQEVFAEFARQRGTTVAEVESSEASALALKRLPRLHEVANAAVLMASDYASAITGTAADASCGDIVD